MCLRIARASMSQCACRFVVGRRDRFGARCRLGYVAAKSQGAALRATRTLVNFGLRMALECPRRGELSELVPDHVLRYVNRDELSAVVHSKRVATKSGVISESRLQVLMTFFLLDSFSASTLR